MTDISQISEAAGALIAEIERGGYASSDGKSLREDTSFRRLQQALTESSHGPAGPHAKPELTDPLATPGTGMLPESVGGRGVDPGTG